MTKVHFCKENTIKLVNAFVFFTGILTICCTIRLSQLMRQKDFPVAAQPSFNNMMKLSVPLHTQIRCHTFPYTTYSNLTGFADSVQNLTNAGTPRSRDALWVYNISQEHSTMSCLRFECAPFNSPVFLCPTIRDLLTPKIWLLILPSGCYTFSSKLVMRTWC